MLFPSTKTILILCEESGAFADIYLNAGYNVVVKDLQIDPVNGDAILTRYIEGGVYGILAFPPCTHFAGSGARWWEGKGPEAIKEGLSVVDACLRAVAIYKPRFWMLENPVGRLKDYIGPPKMTFNPCDYGGYKDGQDDSYTKRTCLWGEFTIPRKKPIEATDGSKMHYIPPGPDRQKLRSKTPMGFANAFFLVNQ